VRPGRKHGFGTKAAADWGYQLVGIYSRSYKSQTGKCKIASVISKVERRWHMACNTEV
jgi:hypothetical protein